jgi:nitroreductase
MLPAMNATPPTPDDAGAAMAALLARHRSIRRFKPDPVDPAWLDDLCLRAIAGSSSSGNLTMVSIVRTMDEARRRRLWALHFEQDMILQAPVLLTFCADTHRTRTWLAQRGARLNFGNFISYHVAAFDAIILSQTVALALEANGLGICYMGTTLHSMREIGEFLELPDHCVPVTTLVVGHPDEAPAPRDRLAPAAYLHAETYRAHDAAAIDALYEARERKGWERYRAMGPEVVARMEALGITSLAQFYTSEMKYFEPQFEKDSAALAELLADKGFMP